MDLFEVICKKLNCGYISDLRRHPCIAEARKEMAQMDLQLCSLKELEDMAEYLYFERPSFSTVLHAQTYFRQGIENG